MTKMDLRQIAARVLPVAKKVCMITLKVIIPAVFLGFSIWLIYRLAQQQDLLTPITAALVLAGLTMAALFSGITKAKWWGFYISWRMRQVTLGLGILIGASYMGVFVQPSQGYWWALVAFWGLGIAIVEEVMYG